MWMRLTLIATAICVAAPALADGFATRDLTGLAVNTTTLSAGEWVSKVEPDRMTLLCLGCDSQAVVDILIGRQDDGTEGRVRSGQTTFTMLQDQCRAKDAACVLEGLDVAPAVGWMTGYGIGAQAAHTIVVLRDGDLLTIRTLSVDAGIARRNADALVAGVVPQVVGQ
jgi:hypothetical protein